MVQEQELTTSKSIHRRTGRTFYFATRLLPERARHATYVLYAFFRVADEVVDDAEGVPPNEQREELERIREAALGREPTDDPVLSAFAEVREQYGIPDREIDEFIDAMLTDIKRRRYPRYEDVESYMRGSSVAVANMMLAVMQPDEPEIARPHAAALAEAFQLTNFLRDVREDVLDRDRIYLPQSTLDSHGVSSEEIADLDPSDGFADAMREELARTESLYREGVKGIAYLPEDCQFSVLLASVLYADHHRLIRAQNYDVLSSEPSLTTARKLRLLVRTRWHWQWTDDPETAFYRASVVPARSEMERTTMPGDPSPTR